MSYSKASILSALCTGFLALIFASHAVADPSATTRYLMSEPVSMLTYGLGQLNIELDEIKGSIVNLFSGKNEPSYFISCFHNVLVI